MEMSICKLSLWIKLILIETVNVFQRSLPYLQIRKRLRRPESLMLFFPRSGESLLLVHGAEYDKDVRKSSKGKDQGPEWIAKGYGMKKEKANIEMRLKQRER